MKCPMCGGDQFTEPKRVYNTTWGLFGSRIFATRCEMCGFLAPFDHKVDPSIITRWDDDPTYS